MKHISPLIILAGLLAAACGPAASGALGPAPTGSARPAVSTPTSASAAATPANQPTAPAATSTTAAQAVPLQVWFTRNGKLFETERGVPATVGIGQAVLRALLAGPSAAEYAAGLRSIPSGTVLHGVRISGGTGTVDLSSSFIAAGSPAMPLRIAQLVYTLTQFPTVTGLRFEIDGQGVTVLGGVPVQSPQTRAMWASYLPPITVQSPLIGAQVTSPVTVTGTADVFEAVVSVRILDAAGHEIARTFSTASCGTGCRGSYSAALSFTVPRAETGTIEVFENSAKTGLPVHVQDIPVQLAP